MMNLESLLKECDELYEKEDFRGLVIKCDEVLDKFPDNQNAMGYKGIAHLALDEDDEALRVLERAVGLYPDNYYLKNNLAMVYYKRGEYETSLRLCEEGLEIRDFDWLCENKFKNLIRLSRYDEAIEFEKTLSHDLSLHLVFLEDGMAQHELGYYSCLLKDNPDDFINIERVKMAAAKLNVAPEVGDYYLKWIDAIKCVSNQTTICPDCGGELIPILMGYPSPDALKQAERGEIHLGGCVIMGNDNFHCKDCGRDFNIANGHVNIDCEDSKLRDYVRFKMHLLESLLMRNSKKCVGFDEIKKEISIFDDKELNALINHLIEIDYIIQPEKGFIKLAGD